MSRLKTSSIESIVLASLRMFAAQTFEQTPLATFSARGLFFFAHRGEVFPCRDENGFRAVDEVRVCAEALPRATASRVVELAESIVGRAFTPAVEVEQRIAIEACRAEIARAEKASVRVVNPHLALRYPAEPATGRIVRFVREGVERFQFVSKSDVSGQIIELLEYPAPIGLWALREHVADVTPKAGRVTRHLLCA
jgi:hypothetical protein